MKLEVGDIVIGEAYSHYTAFVIDRVTATQAASGKSKFKREYSWRVEVLGMGIYNSTTYRIATPELIAKANRQVITGFLSNPYMYKEATMETMMKVAKLFGIELLENTCNQKIKELNGK